MDKKQLKETVLSIVKDDDPYKGPKQLQLGYWCCAFSELLASSGEKELLFFLDVLSDEACWERTDIVHGVKLNRRILAKKMLEPRSWKGTNNPLHDFVRYQVACWCCLEDEIVALFEYFKREDKIKTGDTARLKKLVRLLSGTWCRDIMMEYWSCVVGGYASELKLRGQHPFEYGLDCALGIGRTHVEAVEFFWNKIKSLSDDELSTQKDEIFMAATVRAAAMEHRTYPEVFEFCLGQISSDKYPELLKRDLVTNRRFACLDKLMNAFCFDQFQELFDCLKPSDISEDKFHYWLNFIREKDPEYYADVAAKVSVHMWTKEGFYSPRALVLELGMCDTYYQGRLLVPFVEKNYMGPVWAILDKASPDQIKKFMSCKQAEYIRSVLKERDQNLLNKFLSYGTSVKEELANSSTSLVEVNLKVKLKHKAKRSRIK